MLSLSIVTQANQVPSDREKGAIMIWRWLWGALVLTMLSACGVLPVTQTPVEVTRVVVVVQEVTREVIRVETRMVVATATPEPLSPTLESTTTAAASTATPVPPLHHHRQQRERSRQVSG